MLVDARPDCLEDLIALNAMFRPGPLANTTPVWKRSWVAVAGAGEVPDNAPVQVLVAGDAWVLTRMDGTLTAFEDRCPHQRSPLSDGAVTRCVAASTVNDTSAASAATAAAGAARTRAQASPNTIERIR